MSTLTQLIDRFGVDVLDHLDRQVTVPVHAGLQRQGDVIVVPYDGKERAISPVPPAGAPIVEGEFGGNTHLLLADGPVAFDRLMGVGRDLGIGLLTVADSATAWLAHPEHAYTGIGPGTYEVRRQREQGAHWWRLVAD